MIGEADRRKIGRTNATKLFKLNGRMSCDPFPRLGRQFAMMKMRVITCRGIGPRAAMGHGRL